MQILKHIYRTKVYKRNLRRHTFYGLYGSLFKERIMKCGGLAKIGKTEYYKMLKNAGDAAYKGSSTVTLQESSYYQADGSL